MGELLVYARNDIAGKALCQLLRMRDLKPIALIGMEDLIEKIRFGLGDIVILDLPSIATMREDLNDLLNISSETSVIMLTPYGTEDKELEIFRREGYYFFPKPICINDLIALIGQLREGEDN